VERPNCQQQLAGKNGSIINKCVCERDNLLNIFLNVESEINNRDDRYFFLQDDRYHSFHVMEKI